MLADFSIVPLGSFWEFLPQPTSQTRTTMCQPYQTLFQDRNPIRRLKRKNLDSKVRSMCRLEGRYLAPSWCTEKGVNARLFFDRAFG